MIEEIIDLDLPHVVSPPAPDAQRSTIKVIERRGETVPLVSLGGLFALPAPGKPAGKALIVRHNAEPFAFAIDRMLGQQEVVVRPLEDPLVKVAGVAGATDLGDGKPTLVLDLFGLIGIIAARNQRALIA
jgi:two-component system chemotaxis sensor kinase CheA